MHLFFKVALEDLQMSERSPNHLYHIFLGWLGISILLGIGSLCIYATCPREQQREPPNVMLMLSAAYLQTLILEHQFHPFFPPFFCTVPDRAGFFFFHASFQFLPGF